MFLEPADKCSQGWPLLGFPCATTVCLCHSDLSRLGSAKDFRYQCVCMCTSTLACDQNPKASTHGAFFQHAFFVSICQILTIYCTQHGTLFDIYSPTTLRCLSFCSSQFTDKRLWEIVRLTKVIQLASSLSRIRTQNPGVWFQHIRSFPWITLPLPPTYAHMRAHMHAHSHTHTHTHTHVFLILVNCWWFLFFLDNDTE